MSGATPVDASPGLEIHDVNVAQSKGLVIKFVDRGVSVRYSRADDPYMHYPNVDHLDIGDEVARKIRKLSHPDIERDISKGTYGPQPRIKKKAPAFG